MSSLSASSSLSNLQSESHSSYVTVPPSPASQASSLDASSNQSLQDADEENITITTNRSLSSKHGKEKSQEDLRLLAISTHMTEIAYAISDIQTRIFEIQELRHKSQSTSDTTNTTSVIDQSLMNLDERLDAVGKGLKTVNETIDPLLQVSGTPTVSDSEETNQTAAILRKHAALLAEWESVQDESDVLREELKEDKWLTVFRTVTDQADGMMSSLEKAVNRCQDFIWQVHKKGTDNTKSPRIDRQPVSFEAFTAILESYEAKKKHYMPATSKVLSIIDKGVRDRVTKNGETLRRHAESAQRWRNLRERITRTDTEMDNVRKILLNDCASETGSSTSGTVSSRNGYLMTPQSASSRMSRTQSNSSSLSGSISPFKKLAQKITGSRSASNTPHATTKSKLTRAPGSEPAPGKQTLRRQRSALFGSLRGSEPPTPTTPERPSHKYSQSYTPDSSPHAIRVDTSLSGSSKTRLLVSKQKWNSSTKVESEDKTQTIRGTPPRRPPSATGSYRRFDDMPPVPPLASSNLRSVSRASMASSRPWSPVTSSISTSQSSYHLPIPNFRPPSRSQTPARAVTPGLGATPRPRPKTPSYIPVPAKAWRSFSGSPSDASLDEDLSLLQRAISPTFSTMSSVSAALGHPPRPPSRSMIPVPAVQLSSPSRPSSSMSNRMRSESPGINVFRSSAMRAQTPESALRARVQQVPFFHGTRLAPRPSLNKLPPSSYKDGSLSRAPSRPSSRTGAHTPGAEQLPLYEYVIGNPMDPLDVEVGNIVNSLSHGLLIERVDPPLKKVPKDNEELKAQYSFSNSLSRKVVTCKLTTLTRSGKTGGNLTTKKVMCRVGGGWQDLSHYILNRQAGM
ncbi:hypothetical protein BDQ17DRAFT_1352801 [Cyathus striatus]|nr:hypothetical protein BDQ17DRAFT_1352801 [Cyathus striatus]